MKRYTVVSQETVNHQPELIGGGYNKAEIKVFTRFAEALRYCRRELGLQEDEVDLLMDREVIDSGPADEKVIISFFMEVD
jgi:hypothetical protein